jgi:ATP-binding cassette subfamily C protein
MRDVFAIFFRADGTRPWLVLLCLIAASIAEGIGLATLLPLINLATQPEAVGSSPMGAAISEALAKLGVGTSLGPLVGLVVLALVAKAGLTLVAMRYVGYATAEVAANLRRQLVASLMRVRWRFFVHQPMGRIANAMSNDATRAAQAYLLVAELLTQGVQALIMSVVALFVSWKLALTAYAIGLTMAAALQFLVRMSRKAGWRQTQRTKDLLVFLNDTLINIKPVKAMARQDAFANLLADRIHKLRQALRRQVISREALTALQDVLLAVVLGIGFVLTVIVWQIPLAEVLVTGVVLNRLISSISKIQRAYLKAVQFESAFTAARELIAEAEAAPEANPGRRVPTLERSVEVAAVGFAHDATPVLRDVSLSIPARSLTVLAGPSGSGKTTIIDLVLGLYRPDEGEVTIDGVPLREIDIQRWRGMVGYVPQELLLFNDTVMANVTLGDPELGEAEVQAALATAGAWEFVSRLPAGLQESVGEKGAKLSGGQRQRVAMARALVTRPRLLILDEVTSALDPETAHQLAHEIKGLTRATTVVVVSHRPEFMGIADRIYRVEAGRVEPAVVAAHGHGGTFPRDITPL